MKVCVVPLRYAGLGNNFSFYDELVNLVTWWHRRSLLWEILERTFYLSFLRRYFGLKRKQFVFNELVDKSGKFSIVPFWEMLVWYETFCLFIMNLLKLGFGDLFSGSDACLGPSLPRCISWRYRRSPLRSWTLPAYLETKDVIDLLKTCHYTWYLPWNVCFV